MNKPYSPYTNGYLILLIMLVYGGTIAKGQWMYSDCQELRIYSHL